MGVPGPPLASHTRADLGGLQGSPAPDERSSQATSYQAPSVLSVNGAPACRALVVSRRRGEVGPAHHGVWARPRATRSSFGVRRERAPRAHERATAWYLSARPPRGFGWGLGIGEESPRPVPPSCEADRSRPPGSRECHASARSRVKHDESGNCARGGACRPIEVQRQDLEALTPYSRSRTRDTHRGCPWQGGAVDGAPPSRAQSSWHRP